MSDLFGILVTIKYNDMYTGNDKGLKDEIQGLKDEIQGLKDEIQGLKDEIDYLHRKLEELVVILNQHTHILLHNEKKDNVVVEEIKQGILISKVKSVHFVNEYEFRTKTFEQFLITLEDDSKYYMNKLKETKTIVKDGDTISYKIEGDKMRDVKVLSEI